MSIDTAVSVCGTDINPLTMDESVEEAHRLLHAPGSHHHVTVNAAKIVDATGDETLRSIVSTADLVNADGMSVVWASRVLRNPLPERVAGIDFMQELLKVAASCGHAVYLLGSRQDVVDRLAHRLEHEVPGLQVVGQHHGFLSDAAVAEVVRDVRILTPDIIFVGMPSPAKEMLYRDYLRPLGVPLVVGVGGSFDVLVGDIRRAPAAWQRLGLEWLFRLLQEPRRLWRRYLFGNARFIAMVYSELLQRRRKDKARRSRNSGGTRLG